MSKNYPFLAEKPLWSESVKVDYKNLSVRKILIGLGHRDRLVNGTLGRFSFLDKIYETEMDCLMEIYSLSRDTKIKDMFWAFRGNRSHGRQTLITAADIVSGYCLSLHLNKLASHAGKKSTFFLSGGFLVSPLYGFIYSAILSSGNLVIIELTEENRLLKDQLICVVRI